MLASSGLTRAAAMTTLSDVLWPLAVLLMGLVEAQTLKSPSGSHTMSEETQNLVQNRTTNRYDEARRAAEEIPGVMLKLMSFLLMQVAVSVTADMWE